LAANDSFFVNHTEAEGQNREAEIASICRLSGRSGLFATRCSPVLQNINHRIPYGSAVRAASSPDAFAPHHAADDGRSDGRRTDSNDLTVSNEKGRSGDAATRNSSIGWRRHAIVARSCQPNLILFYSVFKRSMSSGLTRGRIPVRVKKTRQNRKLEPALIPSKPE
jgi:hypothetical protein